MTTREDLTDVETRLRASLRERADDVDTTPALYERVQRQASRGTWLRRGLALAGAAAAVVVAVAIVPPLLPDQPLRPDVAGEPEDALPTATDEPVDEATGDPEPTAPTDSTDPAEPGPADGAAAAFVEEGLAYAEDDGTGGSRVHVGGRTVHSSKRVVSMDVGSSGASTAVVVGLADGSLVGIDVGGSGDGFDQLIAADANGAKAAVSPDVDGIAWIEGTDLHILPLADGAAVRVLPLEGDVPEDLEIEEWFAAADASVILASQPDGGVWSIPMDYSNTYNTAPTDPAFVLDEAALDSVLLPDLRRIDLVRDAEQGLVLSEAGDLRSLPAGGPLSEEVELTANVDGTIVLHDATTGTGHMIPSVDGALATPGFSWQAQSVSAIAPLPAA